MAHVKLRFADHKTSSRKWIRKGSVGVNDRATLPNCAVLRCDMFRRVQAHKKNIV